MKKEMLSVVSTLVLSSVLFLSGCQNLTDLSLKPIKFNEIELVNESIERSSDDRHNIYQARIKNTSNQILSEVSLELVHEDGQRVKILTNDTLKPGETSELLTCIAPLSGELEDIRPIELDTVLIYDDFSRERLIYNVDSKSYQVLEMSALTPIESPVDVHQLLVKLEVGYNQLDELEQLPYLQNETNLSVTNLTFKYELEDGHTISLVHPNRVKESQKVRLGVISKLPLMRIKEMILKEVEFTYTQDDQTFNVTYDASLDQYFQS